MGAVLRSLSSIPGCHLQDAHTTVPSRSQPAKSALSPLQSLAEPGQGPRRQVRRRGAPSTRSGRGPACPGGAGIRTSSPGTFPRPSCLGFLCSSEMGPAFAWAAAGFSSSAAQSHLAFPSSQASHSSGAILSGDSRPGSLTRVPPSTESPNMCPALGLGLSSQGLLPCVAWALVPTFPGPGSQGPAEQAGRGLGTAGSLRLGPTLLPPRSGLSPSNTAAVFRLCCQLRGSARGLP